MARAGGQRRPDILVTGFGPFPGVPRNPTAHLAHLVATSPRLARLGIAARALVLTTLYRALESELEPALGRTRPRALLMLGVAARSVRPRIETRAVNRRSLLYPDAAGRVPRTPALKAGAPFALKGRDVSPALLRQFRRFGLDAVWSRDAGRYLCNAGYFTALAHPAMRGRPTLFVHVPMPRKAGGSRPDRRPTVEALARGLTALAAALARRGRRTLA